MSPADDATPGPIVLYGATGYTGKLVAAELKRRGLDFILSGRSAEKLKALAAALVVDVPLKQATVDNPSSLHELLADAGAVINCAGPFSLLGEPVVKAAVETRTHYVDTTGEQEFMKLVVDRYDEPARKAGIAVVCGMGFDYAPGDCAARLVAEGLEPLDELEIDYSTKGFGTSRGTMLSVLEVLAGDEVTFRSGRWRKPPRLPELAYVDFPQPLGRQPCARFSSGEAVTVPRHTNVQNVITRLNAHSVAPRFVPGAVAAYMMLPLSIALKTPLRRALGKAIQRAPEGPSLEARKAATFTILCKARGTKGQRAALVHGGDIYGITAVIAVQAAYLQSQLDYDKRGVLSAASAFEPRELFDYLKDFGVTIELGERLPR